MRFELVTSAASEPVTLAEAKSHLRVEHSDDDVLIASLVSTARELVESHTARQLVTADWKLHLDRFPHGDIEIRKCPVASVTSVTYYDENNTQQTWSTSLYQVDTVNEPARIRCEYNVTYPSTRSGKLNAVTVNFTAGQAVASVSDKAKHAILLLVSHWYENTEAAGPRNLYQAPLAVHSLVNAMKWTDYT